MLATQIVFQTTPWSVTLTGLIFVIVCMLSAWAYYCSGFRPAILVTELLRVVSVGIVGILINQPEVHQTFRTDQRPSLVVLIDQSRSMDTQDVLAEESTSQVPQTRRAAAEPLLAAETWSEFNARFDVVVTPFATEDSSTTTDIYQAIMEARQQQPAMRAMVLVSDGDWNSGPPPVEAAIGLRSEQIPIFSVPLGSQSRMPDVELVSFDVPTYGSEGKSVRIPVTIESWLPRDYSTDLQLTVSDGTTVTQPILIPAMGRVSDVVVWKPQQVGDYSLKLTVPQHIDERFGENNTREAPISIREEKLKVLVIETFPRWEYRFLRNALSRDPGVQLHCLLFHPGLSKVGGGGSDYIPSFPESLEQLSEYDVIFLGDVGISAGQLTWQQCELIAGLVEQQASGLVFMPGLKGYQLTLIDSPLDPLIPVVFDTTRPGGHGSPLASNLVLTEQGRRSLLTKLGDSPDTNVQIWEALPGFQWHAGVVRAKAGAEVLAVHRDSSNEYGRLPLLATRTFGSGKVLFMGTDGAWRWRRGVEDLYHYRFWGQVVRWMAYQRNMAKGEAMRFFYSPEQPVVRSTIALTASAAGPGGEPLTQAEMVARIVSPSGRLSTVRLSGSGTQWGAFHGNFTPNESGLHLVTLNCQENAAELEATIFVQGKDIEQIGRPIRMDVMEELALITRGKLIQNAEFSDLAQAVRDLPDPPEQIRRVALWSHPASASILIACLTGFWVGRKMIGMI
jgi:hypothetical protein